MKTISKRLAREKSKVQKISYDVREAIDLVKSTASTKFNESMEAHISLFIDPKYADQQLRTTVSLPHGTGKERRIAVLLPTDSIGLASKSNADVIGSDDDSSGNNNVDSARRAGVLFRYLSPTLCSVGRPGGPVAPPGLRGCSQ